MPPLQCTPQAYYWLRHNTDPDAKIMSWWDYGYQVRYGMARYGTCEMVRYGMVRYGTVRNGIVRNGMARHGTERSGAALVALLSGVRYNSRSLFCRIFLFLAALCAFLTFIGDLPVVVAIVVHLARG